MTTVSNEEMQELGELCESIFSSVTPVQRIQQLEAEEVTWDEKLWGELAQAGLLAVALPESVGGMGLGLEAVTTVLEAQGKHVAPAPLWSTLLAHVVLSRDAEAFADHLEQAGSGAVRTGLAFEERQRELADPNTAAIQSGDSWTVTGHKVMVVHADALTHVLVSARAGDEVALFLVDMNEVRDGVERSLTTDRGAVAAITFHDTPAVKVELDEGGFSRVMHEAFIVLSSLQLGVARGALGITAGYVSEREQFGRPIGTFQSLQHQLADAQISADALELVLAQALDHASRNEAALFRSARVASWWAREGATDVVYTCQHVHGGIGVDIDYPIHRFFLWGKQLSNTFGNAETMLEQLGGSLREGRVAA